MRELQYALKATNVNELVYGGDIYDQYTSDNDYRSSKRGIEKLNLENLEKYRRRRELDQDEMSVEGYKTGGSRYSLYKQAVKERDHRRADPKGYAFDSRDNFKKTDEPLEVGGDFKEYFSNHQDNQPKNTYNIPDSDRYRNTDPFDRKTPDKNYRDDRFDRTPTQDRVVRDVASQI